MLRPLLLTDRVTLVFDEPEALPLLSSDEGKVSQILRNFLSNALKFTEQGDIRLSATLTPAGDAVVFVVADTGIGIAPEDQEAIFEEFVQIAHPIQQRVKGTGLGLPLCKNSRNCWAGAWRCAAPLGSARRSPPPSPCSIGRPVPRPRPRQTRGSSIRRASRCSSSRTMWRRSSSMFPRSRFQPLPVRTLREAEEALVRVAAGDCPGCAAARGDTWMFLATLKNQDATKGIPVLVVTTVEDQRKGWALGADAYAIKPITRAWLLGTLQQHTEQPPGPACW